VVLGFWGFGVLGFWLLVSCGTYVFWKTFPGSPSIWTPLVLRQLREQKLLGLKSTLSREDGEVMTGKFMYVAIDKCLMMAKRHSSVSGKETTSKRQVGQ